MSDVLGILWSPVRTIRARCEQPIALGIPFAIFVGALLLFLVDMAIMYSAIIATLPPDNKLGMANLGFSLNLVFFGVNMFLFWIVGSGILACLAVLLDGEGEYRRVLELTGLAHLPSLIFGVIGLGLALSYQPHLRLDSVLDRHAHGAKLTVEQQKSFEEDLRKEVTTETRRQHFVLIHTCRYAFTLWTLVLCVIAVRYSFDLDYFKSGMSVAGLVLLYISLETVRSKMIGGP